MCRHSCYESRQQTLKMVAATIACVWLFYFLSAILQVGLGRVDVNGVASDHAIVQNRFDDNAGFQRFWKAKKDSGTRRNDYGRFATRQKSILVTKIKITKGLCALFPRSTVCRQMVPVIHSLAFIIVTTFFVVNIGSQIKLLLDDLVFRSVVQDKNESTASKIKSIAISLLFLVAGLILCIPVRNLYIADFREQEEQNIKDIVRAVKTEAVVHLFRIRLLFPFYFSILCTGFFLSYSYCLATVLHILPHEQLTDDESKNNLLNIDQRVLKRKQKEISAESDFLIHLKHIGGVVV